MIATCMYVDLGFTYLMDQQMRVHIRTCIESVQSGSENIAATTSTKLMYCSETVYPSIRRGVYYYSETRGDASLQAMDTTN